MAIDYDIPAILWGEGANDPEGWTARLNTYNKAKREGESLANTMRRVSSAYRGKSKQYQKAKSVQFNDFELPIWNNLLQTVSKYKPDEGWKYKFHENYSLPDYAGLTEGQIDEVLKGKWGKQVDFGNKVKIGKEYYFPEIEQGQAPQQAAIKTNRLSPHFTIDEFNQSGAPLPPEEIKVSQELVDRLEMLRELIGKPIRITSGYRNKEYNKKVGGVPGSQHPLGNAADIMAEGMTAKELEKFAKQAGFTFTQTYKSKPHLHVDVRKSHYKKE